VKKYVLGLLLLLTSSVNTLSACDVCGCAAGGSYFGILPQFHKQFIGLRYSFSMEDTKHTAIEASGNYTAHDFYHSMELWGRFYPAKRLQVLAFLPFRFYQEKTGANSQSVFGLGDISVISDYAIINTGEDRTKKVKQTLFAGAGIKLPTGLYRAQHDGTLLDHNLQPGTGSTDFILNGMYTIRIKKYGVNADVTGKLTTANNLQYRFGNRITSSLRAFYWANVHGYSLLPHSGILYDYSGNNYDKGKAVALSASDALFATAGLDVYIKRISLSVAYQYPIYQNLGMGMVQGGSRIFCGMAVHF